MEAILFIIHQMFFTIHLVLKIGEYYVDISQFQPQNFQTHDAFNHMQAKIFDRL